MTFIILVLVLGISFTLSNLKDDINRLEKKVDKISNNFGIEDFGVNDLDENLLDELTILVNNDEEVKAVKRLRDETGFSLKEAKQLVNQI